MPVSQENIRALGDYTEGELTAPTTDMRAVAALYNEGLGGFTGPARAALLNATRGVAATLVSVHGGFGYFDPAYEYIGLRGPAAVSKELFSANDATSQAAELALDQQGITGFARDASSAARIGAEALVKNNIYMGMGGVAVGSQAFGAISGAMNETGAQTLYAARDSGMSEGKALGTALASAIVEGGVTYVFNKIGLGGLESGFRGGSEPLRQEAKKALSQYIKNAVRHSTKHLTAEEVEELTIMTAQAFIASTSGLDPTALDMDKLISNAYQTALVTAFAATPGGGITGLAETRTARANAKAGKAAENKARGAKVAAIESRRARPCKPPTEGRYHPVWSRPERSGGATRPCYGSGRPRLRGGTPQSRPRRKPWAHQSPDRLS